MVAVMQEQACPRCGWPSSEGECRRAADSGDACDLYAFADVVVTIECDGWSPPDPAMRLTSPDADVQRWLDGGHSPAWCEWYKRFCDRWVYGRAVKISKREEYALFVVSAAGPAVDKLAKRYCPPKRGAR